MDRCRDYLQLTRLEKINKIKSIDNEISNLLSQQHKHREIIRKSGVKQELVYQVLKSNFSEWDLGYGESSPRHGKHIEFTLEDIYSLDENIVEEISRLSSKFEFNMSC